jgi:hypothetical protein
VIRLTSKYWLVAATPGGTYTLRAALYDNDPQINEVVLGLHFVDADANRDADTHSHDDRHADAPSPPHRRHNSRTGRSLPERRAGQTPVAR